MRDMKVYYVMETWTKNGKETFKLKQYYYN